LNFKEEEMEKARKIISRAISAKKWTEYFSSWSDERCKKMWNSLGGTHTSCINKMKGHISDPGGYCNALGKRATGKWVREK